MKLYIIITFIFLVNPFFIIGQTCITEEVPGQDVPACCNDLISTDFNYPNNTEYPALENTTIEDGGPNDHPLFNWLAPTQILPDQHTLNVNIGNTLVPAEHPFLLDLSDYYWFSYYRNGQGFPQEEHNMHPRYGWELMHMNRGLGLYGDTELDANSTLYNPYMLFYNKYTGKLRLIVSPGQGQSFDNANTDLSIIEDPGNNDLKVSALLNRYNTFQTALDQATKIEKVSSDLPFTTPNKWSISDFQLAYDPCVCKNEARIKFEFKERNFASVLMTGRIVGREVPLNTSGNNPLAFGDDFLSSVLVGKDENNIDIANAGMLIYNQIDQDVESAYVNETMKLLGEIFSTIGSPLKNIKAGFSIPGGDEPIKVKSGPFLSAAAGFASKQLNPPAPKITYLEAEAAFSGIIEDESNSGGLASIELLHPGSYSADRLAVPWTQHTFYNEIPGLFALLKTPNLQFAYNPGAPYVVTGGFGLAIEEPLEYVLNPAAEIDMENTKIYAAVEFDVYDSTFEPWHNLTGLDTYNEDPGYPLIATLMGQDENSDHYFITTSSTAYNAADPIAKILEPSFDLAAVEFVEGNQLIQQFPFLEDYSRHPYPDYEDSGLKTKLTFQTVYVPIDKLDDLRFTEIFRSLDINAYYQSFNPEYNDLFNFRLKILADYKFLPNEYGDVNETVQVYTYEIGEKNEVDFSVMDDCVDSNNPICDTEIYNQYDFQTNLIINTTHYTGSQDIYADIITIDGDLSTDPGVTINLYATNEIFTENGSISPDINLIIFEPYPHDGLNVVAEEDLNLFCNSSSYKASQPAIRKIPPENQAKVIVDFEVFPNPANKDLSLKLKLKQDSEISIRLMDLNGRIVKTLVDNGQWLKGEQIRLFQIPEVRNSGLYFLEVCVDESCSTQKVSFIK